MRQKKGTLGSKQPMSQSNKPRQPWRRARPRRMAWACRCSSPGRRAQCLGGWSYEAVDTTLAHDTKIGTILQLCMYSDLLGDAQGVAPEFASVVTPLVRFRASVFGSRISRRSTVGSPADLRRSWCRACDVPGTDALLRPMPVAFGMLRTVANGRSPDARRRCDRCQPVSGWRCRAVSNRNDHARRCAARPEFRRERRTCSCGWTFLSCPRGRLASSGTQSFGCTMRSETSTISVCALPQQQRWNIGGESNGVSASQRSAPTINFTGSAVVTVTTTNAKTTSRSTNRTPTDCSCSTAARALQARQRAFRRR